MELTHRALDSVRFICHFSATEIRLLRTDCGNFTVREVEGENQELILTCIDLGIVMRRNGFGKSGQRFCHIMFGTSARR